MHRPRTRSIVRDLVALALLAALGLGGYGWYRSAEASRRWVPVRREAEGLVFRLPPGWEAGPGGFGDPEYIARRPGGMLLAVRSFAIPPEMRDLRGGARNPERAAIEAWAESQRARAFGTQRLLEDDRLRVAGARAVLQVFEEPRAAYPYLAVAAAAHEGRIYSFSVRLARGGDADDAERTLRRILRTVEWVPRPAAATFTRPGGPL